MTTGCRRSRSEDKRGLRVIARVEDARAGLLVTDGKLNGLSFGYRVREARPGAHRQLIDPRPCGGQPGREADAAARARARC
jgi:hypothetical protein